MAGPFYLRLRRPRLHCPHPPRYAARVVVAVGRRVGRLDDRCAGDPPPGAWPCLNLISCRAGSRRRARGSGGRGSPLHAIELVDIIEDVVDGRVAIGARVARHPIEDVVDALRQRAVDLRRHRRATARQLARQQLVENDAERVDVALRPGRRRVGVELERHVRVRVAHADIDLADHGVIALDDAREPEVEEPDVAIRIDQQLLEELQRAVKVRAGCAPRAARAASATGIETRARPESPRRP